MKRKHPSLTLRSYVSPRLGGRLAALAVCLCIGLQAHADMVTDWNATLGAALNASGELPPLQQRQAAIVQLAVFDAVNGIARKYEPYFVTTPGPRGARKEAAVAGAAYTTLVALFPAQKPLFDAQLAASLTAIPGGESPSESVARGMAWGESVANAILTWRSADNPLLLPTDPPLFVPLFGGTAIGEWRSVPDGSKPGVFPGYQYITPFTMTSGSEFRPDPPFDLTSPQYAADFNEVKSLGAANSTTRTADQTSAALLWQAAGAASENAMACSALPAGADLVDNARVLALVNMVGCDAFISGFDAKYHYLSWRPYHAIHFADLDGNPATTADTSWTSLITPVPNHPEYFSFHSVFTGSFMRVLMTLLGDNHPLTLTAPSLPGVSRSYNSFSQVVAEVKEARIWGGLHFRNSCNVGQGIGYALADQALDNFLRPIDRDRDRDGNHGHGADGDGRY